MSHDYVPIPSMSTDLYQVEQTYQTISSLIVRLNGAGFTTEANDLQSVLDGLVAVMDAIKAAVVA